jgi:hypothetical protein
VNHVPEINDRIVDTGAKEGLAGQHAFLFTDPEGSMMGLWKAKR